MGQLRTAEGDHPVGPWSPFVRYPGLFPVIEPVPEGVSRPLWSVMITTYNRVDYLSSALTSVLYQDPGPETMQIEVVDNSTTDIVEKLVREVGRERIQVHRIRSRITLSGAMTLSIQRARGLYVHILHDDDVVLPGFYLKLQNGLTQDSRIGAAFCRNAFIDQNDRQHSLALRVQASAGVVTGWLEQIAVRQRIQVAAIAVKRKVYEELGGFCSGLSHTADWEMWRRIASRYLYWYEPQVLAFYRVHPSSDTSRLQRSGGNIADSRKSIEIAERFLPVEKRAALSALARKHLASKAVDTARRMLSEHEYVGAANQTLQAFRTSPRTVASLLLNSSRLDQK
jgi:glycosyltransferase involved in cell wall biosynthesis